MNEQQLIDLLKKNDSKGIDFFVAQYQALIFRKALGILLQSDEAEEITQDVLMDGITKIEQFQGNASLATWLLTITTNKCFELIRYKSRKKRFAPLRSLFKSSDSDELIEIEADGIRTDNLVMNSEFNGKLNIELQRLPDNQRLAFSLIYLNEMTYKEASSLMNTSQKALESLLSRAKKTLKTRLEEYKYAY